MIFTSLDFAIFLPTVFFLYWIVFRNSTRNQNFLIIISSYIFYGWWDWRFLALIIFSSIVDYSVGLGLSKTDIKRSRKILLVISIIVNLGLLGFFKYFNFFLDNVTWAFSLFGHQINPSGLSIILPVGISFYTFQTLSYSIDIYRGKMQPTKDIISFFAFVSFFPQLVAGPIERASNLLPQFLNRRLVNYQAISEGVKQILWGIFMKVVVADRAAIYVNAVYNNVDKHDGLSFMAATLQFSFQIYGDFAGYSLMAIGIAKLFGFELMTNFKRPYLSGSVSEFWSRWHISLSTWFRDYLYIPLGGNRVSIFRWGYIIMITFIVSGLWHGANWTFIAWGALNGIYLIMEKIIFKKRVRKLVSIISTFILINISWILFRANSIQEAFHIMGEIATNPGTLFIGSGPDVTTPIYTILAITILLIVDLKREFFNSVITISHNKSEFVNLFTMSILIYIILYLGVFGESQFIYFQF
jgi:alginate O-acetyltransferase complex protein AlgI